MLGSRRQLSSVVRALLGALTSTCLLLTPQLANASSYQVVACDDASAYGYMNNAWTYTTTDATRLERIGSENASCQSNGSDDDYLSGMGVKDILGTTDDDPEAYWTLTPPSGASVTGVNAYYYLGKILDNDWRPYIKIGGTVVKTCDYSSGLGCAVTTIENACDALYSGTCTWSSNTSLSGTGSSVQIGVSCDTANCQPGGTLHHAWSVVHGITVTLSESDAPSLNIASSDFSSTGDLAGTQSVTFSATDTLGIKEARLYVDGNAVASSIYSCDYTYVTPCSNQSGKSLSYDVTSLSDGDHSAYVRVYDAADNTTDSTTWSFTTDNTPNTGSGSGTGTGSGTETGGGSGSGAETGGGTTGGESGAGTGTGTETGTETGTGQSTDTGSTVGGSSDSSGTDSGNSSANTDTTATKSVANLKIKSSKLKSGRLTVKGTCARHTYTKRFRLSYTPSKGETIRKSFKCTKGKWALTLALERRASTGRLTASYSGDERIAKAKVRRRVRS